MSFFITEKCVKCGACKSECPNKAIVEEPSKFTIDQHKCVHCGACICECPNQAIVERK